jgi:hypothetical protein
MGFVCPNTLKVQRLESYFRSLYLEDVAVPTKGAVMYQIIVRIREIEFVAEIVDSLESASNCTLWYRQQGYHAFYRAALRKTA